MPPGAEALQKISPREDNKLRRNFIQQNCTPQGDVFCGTREPNKTNILLLGDSRVLDMYIALKTAFPDASIRASYAMGCAAVFSADIGQSQFYPDCPEFNQIRLQEALDAPDTDIVFFAQNVNDWRADAILSTVQRFTDAGKTVYLLGDFEFVRNRTPIEISIDMMRFHPHGASIERYLREEPFKLDGKFAEDVSKTGAVYISNRDFFFDGEYHFTDRVTGKMLTFDGVHLNSYGAKQFGEYLRQHYPLP